MDPKEFYESLWRMKAQSTFVPAPRDWFHAWVLDPVFDPNANSRHDVALQLLTRGERLLDIGCWNGDFLTKIRDAGLFEDLEGIDLTVPSVALAQGKGFKAKVVDLNGEALPFPDGSFDAVTILAVLEHVFDPYFVIDEIVRVLRPGGILVIAVPNVASFTNRIRIVFGRIPVTSTDIGWDGGHLHYFTKHAFDRLLTAAGFKILARKTSGGRPRLRQSWISLLGGELIYSCRRR